MFSHPGQLELGSPPILQDFQIEDEQATHVESMPLNGSRISVQAKGKEKAAFLSALLTVSLGLLEAILPVSACRKPAGAGSHHKSRAQSGAKK